MVIWNTFLLFQLLLVPKNRNVDFSKWEMGLDFNEYPIFWSGWRCKSYLHILKISKILVRRSEISIRPVEYSIKSEHSIFTFWRKIESWKFHCARQKVQVFTWKLHEGTFWHSKHLKYHLCAFLQTYLPWTHLKYKVQVLTKFQMSLKNASIFMKNEYIHKNWYLEMKVQIFTFSNHLMSNMAYWLYKASLKAFLNLYQQNLDFWNGESSM